MAFKPTPIKPNNGSFYDRDPLLWGINNKDEEPTDYEYGYYPRRD